MQWIAPSEKDLANETLEKRLWAAADQLRANSGLTSQQYSQPVLGLIFLRFAEDKERLPADVGPGRHFAFGLPRTDNANYLWIHLFTSAPSDPSTGSGQAASKGGRAGFVMANSAFDARLLRRGD